MLFFFKFWELIASISYLSWWFYLNLPLKNADFPVSNGAAPFVMLPSSSTCTVRGQLEPSQFFCVRRDDRSLGDRLTGPGGPGKSLRTWEFYGILPSNIGDFHGFSWILMDVHGFWWILGICKWTHQLLMNTFGNNLMIVVGKEIAMGNSSAKGIKQSIEWGYILID